MAKSAFLHGVLYSSCVFNGSPKTLNFLKTCVFILNVYSGIFRNQAPVHFQRIFRIASLNSLREYGVQMIISFYDNTLSCFFFFFRYNGQVFCIPVSKEGTSRVIRLNQTDCTGWAG